MLKVKLKKTTSSNILEISLSWHHFFMQKTKIFVQCNYLHVWFDYYRVKSKCTFWPAKHTTRCAMGEKLQNIIFNSQQLYHNCVFYSDITHVLTPFFCRWALKPWKWRAERTSKCPREESTTTWRWNSVPQKCFVGCTTTT